MDDLISRQAAIDAICEECHMETDYHRCEGYKKDSRWCEYSTALNDLPSAQQWIPCSERLPQARRSVILSTKDWSGEGCYWETTKHHVIWKGYRWNATYWDDEVIAWMPRPEPYKGEES